jgi:sphingolipid delta-4 desaturase
VAYLVGGTCTQSLTLAIHEVPCLFGFEFRKQNSVVVSDCEDGSQLSHNLMFASVFANRWFSMFANLPLVAAYAVSFKKYHMEHHAQQGVDGVDMDIPTPIEGRIFTTSLRKFFWVFFQVLFYAFRPVLVKPYEPGRFELYNWIIQLSFNAAMVYQFGAISVGYFLLSMLLGLGPHPMAGHFIAEHYVFVEGFETYSYYGPLNFLGFWVGFHNEHHDFPRVPGSRLHKIRELAPEFYDNLPQYTSWSRVLYDYVFTPTVTPFSRMKRGPPSSSRGGDSMD